MGMSTTSFRRGLSSRSEWIASLLLFAVILLALALAALLGDPLSVLGS